MVATEIKKRTHKEPTNLKSSQCIIEMRGDRGMPRARKYKPFCNKPFYELTKEEIWHMRRSSYRIQYDDFVDYYKITAIGYSSKIKELGFVLTREERKSSAEEHNIIEPLKPIKKEYIKPIELKAMRLFRGYDEREMANKIGSSLRSLVSYEKHKALEYIQKMYIEELSIKESELKRIRAALNGKVKKIEFERDIPNVIKKDVFKRDEGKCTRCDSKQNLHYHHIKRFSEGGLHHVANIELLCVACHAEEHKEERSYYMLLKMAEGDM